MQEEVLPVPRESFNLEPTANRLVKPLISVILATKGNKSMLLERCIISLQNQTFQEFEIVLVYSIFPKQLSQLLETGNIVTLKETSSTLGAARNLGVKHAKAELVAFIDDDAEAPEDWLKKIYSTFQQDPSLFCLGGPHLTPIEESKKSPLIFVQGSFLESHLKGKYFDRSAVGKIAGCNVSYRKIVFDKIGYLDETLRSGEDWEFHRRLAENGYRLCFDPEISVLHHRQGLKHAFWNSSKMVPFYLSWKTLKYARYESLFASFYLTNLLCLVLLITLLISPFIFFLLLLSILFGHFIFTAVRTKTYNWRIIFYPLVISFTLARLTGFYFGLFKRIAFNFHH
ncbi:MAG: glycosyltransferase [Candidatus Bathyarchaeia archaeon]|jgi:GT2 family glycosyltransferase